MSRWLQVSPRRDCWADWWRADVALMVVRNTLRGLQDAEVRLAAVGERLGGARPVGLVIVGGGPFSRRDVERTCSMRSFSPFRGGRSRRWRSLMGLSSRAASNPGS